MRENVNPVVGTRQIAAKTKMNTPSEARKNCRRTEYFWGDTHHMEPPKRTRSVALCGKINIPHCVPNCTVRHSFTVGMCPLSFAPGLVIILIV